MLREKQFAKEVVVAKGKEPIDGEDAHFCYYFKKEVNPNQRYLLMELWITKIWNCLNL